jgi:hypothetical protein
MRLALAFTVAVTVGCSSKSAPTSGTAPSGSQGSAASAAPVAAPPAVPAQASPDASAVATTPVDAAAPAAAAPATGHVELISVTGPGTEGMPALSVFSAHVAELATCATTDELEVIDVAIDVVDGKADDLAKMTQLSFCIHKQWKDVPYPVRSGTYHIKLAVVPRVWKRATAAADYVAALTAVCNAFPDDGKDHKPEDLDKLVAKILKDTPQADVSLLWNAAAKVPMTLRRLRLVEAAGHAGLPGCRLAQVM